MLYNFVNAKHKAEQQAKKSLKNSVQQKKKIEVIPVDAQTASGIFLEILLKKKEIKIFAEFKSEKIFISVKTKEGTSYDVMSYDDSTDFWREFRQK